MKNQQPGTAGNPALTTQEERLKAAQEEAEAAKKEVFSAQDEVEAAQDEVEAAQAVCFKEEEGSSPNLQETLYPLEDAYKNAVAAAQEAGPEIQQKLLSRISAELKQAKMRAGVGAEQEGTANAEVLVKVIIAVFENVGRKSLLTRDASDTPASLSVFCHGAAASSPASERGLSAAQEEVDTAEDEYLKAEKRNPLKLQENLGSLEKACKGVAAAAQKAGPEIRQKLLSLISAKLKHAKICAGMAAKQKAAIERENAITAAIKKEMKPERIAALKEELEDAKAEKMVADEALGIALHTIDADTAEKAIEDAAHTETLVEIITVVFEYVSQAKKTSASNTFGVFCHGAAASSPLPSVEQAQKEDNTCGGDKGLCPLVR